MPKPREHLWLPPPSPPHLSSTWGLSGLTKHDEPSGSNGSIRLAVQFTLVALAAMAVVAVVAVLELRRKKVLKAMRQQQALEELARRVRARGKPYEDKAMDGDELAVAEEMVDDETEEDYPSLDEEREDEDDALSYSSDEYCDHTDDQVPEDELEEHNMPETDNESTCSESPPFRSARTEHPAMRLSAEARKIICPTLIIRFPETA
ncbi:hypothetical protein AB1Y20_020527 [Prymnesium parvum]|uniref:Uncharacterized protein n=1 Tax=Prymnesium parvum TaxID=97485 RepID=A0AB34JXU7_PRYPA